MLGANTAIAKTTIKYLHKYTLYHPVSLLRLCKEDTSPTNAFRLQHYVCSVDYNPHHK